MDEQTTADAAPITEEETPTRWARVEIMGHRTHWGRVTEIEQFGAKMIRIDVPQGDQPDAPMLTVEYGGASLFGIMWTDEATARKHNKIYEPPARYLPAPQREDEDELVDDPLF